MAKFRCEAIVEILKKWHIYIIGRTCSSVYFSLDMIDLRKPQKAMVANHIILRDIARR